MSRKSFALIGALVLAALLGQPALAAPAALRDTVRCMHSALAENHLTEAAARHLAVGRVLKVDTRSVVLTRGDSIWKWCRILSRVVPVPDKKPAAEIATTVTPTASPAPPPAAMATEEELDSLRTQVAALQKITGTRQTDIAALGKRLDNLDSKTDLTNASLTETRRSLSRISGVQSALHSVRVMLAIAAFLLFVELVVFGALLYLLIQKRRRSAPVTGGAAPAAADTKPLALDAIPFSFAADAVELESPGTNRTFVLRPTGLHRRADGLWEMYCELPWGKTVKYDPRNIVRLLHSEEANTFFARNGLHLRDVHGARLLEEPLPANVYLCGALVMTGKESREYPSPGLATA